VIQHILIKSGQKWETSRNICTRLTVKKDEK